MANQLALTDLTSALQSAWFYAPGDKLSKSALVSEMGTDKVWSLMVKAGRLVRGVVQDQDFDLDSANDRAEVAGRVLLVLRAIKADSTILLADLLSILAAFGFSERMTRSALSSLHNQQVLTFNQAVPPEHIIPRW